MIVGFTILKIDGNPYFTPVFGRGGASGLFSLDLTHLSAGAGLVTLVEHKNSEDTTWSTAGTFAILVSTGPASLDVTGLKEQIRLQFAFTGGSAVTDAAHIVLQAPTWRPY